MICVVVFFIEVRLQFFPKLEQHWGSPYGCRDVVPDPGCIDGKGLMPCFFFFTLLSL